MCDCDKINILSLPSHLKIYTIMAKYKIKKEYEELSSEVGNFGKVLWSEATQEVLSYLYEEREMKSIITKISSNEESSAKKTKSIKKDD